MGEAGTLSNDRLGFLDSARAWAIIMVVCSHSLGYCVPFSYETYHLIAFIVRTATTAVFFFSDGFLFAYKEARGRPFDYRAHVRQSLTRLMVPWLIFTTLYTAARYLFELMNLPGDRLILGKPPLEVLLSGYGAVYASQLYFLFSMFLIRLGAPVYRGMLGLKTRWVVLCFLLYHLAYPWVGSFLFPRLFIPGGFEPITYAFWGCKYFLAGMVIQRLGIIPSRTAFGVTAVVLVLGLLFMGLAPLPDGTALGRLQFDTVQYAYLLTVFFVFFHLIRGGAFLSLVGTHTMGIYLLHAPIILRVTAMVVNRAVSGPALSFALIAAIVFTLGLSASMGVNRIPYGRVLFGIPYKKPEAKEEEFIPPKAA